jgi:hypothetical protein
MYDTGSGALSHWNHFTFQANFQWADGYAEGFISDVAIPVELLSGSQRSKLRRLARMSG